jgi:hypothetical protein
LETSSENIRLTSLQNSILVRKNYVLTLQKRLFFIREGWVLLTDKQKNEIEIEEYEIAEKIKQELYKIKKIETVYEKDFNQFSVDLNSLKDNYDNLLEFAKKNQNKDFAIKHLLYAVNWKLLNENIVEKIKFFKDLQNTLEHYEFNK